MNTRDALLYRFAQWGRAHLRRQVQGISAVLQDSHSCWMPRGNRYVEHDIGNKNIRYPDGTRSVRVTKVRDTAGMTFYSFAAETPLL